MEEPGLDRHEWESELGSLEEALHDDPAAALPELEQLVGRTLEESGYDLTDPVTLGGDEREIVAEYLAARELTEAAERDAEELSPGDVAAAVNGFRAVFAHVVTARSAADAALGEAEES